MRQSQTFPPIPGSVREARLFATDLLADLGASLIESIQLMVSELATNAVQHGRTAFEVTVLRSGDRVRVEVTDDALGNPTMRSPGPDEPTGRGLQIVNLLADEWGVERRVRDGKTVWLTLSGGTATR
jgi:anti-sigma regulatory factor (Ser/Thr protein kinase)